MLSSWKNEECCSWSGVKCSNTTGHILVLNLRGNFDTSLTGNISPSLVKLQYLKYLDLSFNNFGGQIPKFIGYFERLEYLNLSFSYNPFTGLIPLQFQNLTHLKTLDLGQNSLTVKSLEWLSNLVYLEYLDLHFSNVQVKNWLQEMIKLPNLRELHLSACQLPVIIPSSLVSANISSSHLSILDISYNRYSSPAINSWLFNFTSLTSLDLSGNDLGQMSSGFGYLNLAGSNQSLEYLSFEGNAFTGSLINLTRFSYLRELRLLENSLNGIFHESFRQISNLEHLDLSNNQMTGSLPDLAFFPSLRELHIQSNHFYGMIPQGISDTMPSWFSKLPPMLTYLNLSYNQISGKIQDLSANNISPIIIDFGYNNFSGPLPTFPQLVSALRIDNNQISGSLNSICKIRSAVTLDLSDNLLSGEIPDCWTLMSVPMVLNLANNHISGSIPYSLCSSTSLSSLYVRNNNLSGQFPASLKTCQGLKVLDLGRNTFSGKIPEWIGTELAYLGILSLRFNGFSGSIPPSICQLQSIQILDLSGNRLSGRIPKCFSNFTTMQLLQDGSSVSYDFNPYTPRVGTLYHGNALVQWKNKESEYRNILWLLKTIDLSSNDLVGDIPKDFSRMNALLSLNLSRNNLTGNIVEGIGLMKMLESLDLSRNHLSGKIPVGLANLTFLSVLDLSNNNLSGRIPSSTQLQGFDSSTYGGNVQLCGPPLPECPSFAPPNLHVGHDSNFQENDDDDEFPSKEFYISMALGFIVAFGGVLGSLLLNSSWRNAYFKWLHL
ncbi:hypothetical protein MTR67_030186 [Solanum verrucosum]|uniref:Disease resistance R13L4/SHOC-2-like LRR domain-containing protein n=1 Tax=Solanum verrucosum TaxID=315347 RepID=A0AAF0TXY2_SOLVR|nr:hypothetical protein MTR67_030186 [Solanum verrucosum]